MPGYKKHLLYLLWISLANLAVFPLRAQDKEDWRYQGNVNFGVNLYFFTGHGQRFPGWKAFCGFSAAATYRRNFLLNYGPSLAIYSKSLGANLNPLVDDIQVDFAHSFSIGGCWGAPLLYSKYFRTLGNAGDYNVVINNRNAVLLSSIFIFNNHHRNQAVAALTGSFRDFTINYYNDGGAPLDFLAMSDHFDRYWTGGLGVFIHTRDNYNRAELTFDQFTGYEPMLYEMSTLLGIRMPSYNLQMKDSVGGPEPNSYNTSAYNIRIFPTRGYAIDAGVAGSLRTGRGVPTGLQDIIHTLGRYALHPNEDINRFYIGGTILNANHVRF